MREPRAGPFGHRPPRAGGERALRARHPALRRARLRGHQPQDIAEATGLTRPALYHYVAARRTSSPSSSPSSPTGRPSAARCRAEKSSTRPSGCAGSSRRRAAAATGPAKFRLLIRSEAELPPDLATLRRQPAGGAQGHRRGDRGRGARRPVPARRRPGGRAGVLGMCNWVAWWFHHGGRETTESGRRAARRHGRRRPASAPTRRSSTGEGPAAALKMLRQDLDHLERILDV